MAKSKKLSPQQKAAITKARNKAEKAAKEAARKQKANISSKIAYRNKKLKKDVSILPEDKKIRERYEKELRALYKEQNPNKNKRLTKRERINYEEFRAAAKMQLRILEYKSESEIEDMSPKERKSYFKELNYYKNLINKTTDKILKDRPDFESKINTIQDEQGLDVDAEVINFHDEMLSFQAQETLIPYCRNDFFTFVQFYINSTLHKSITLTKNNRLTIGIDFKDFVDEIRRRTCGTPKYTIETYSNGSIIVTCQCRAK